jgi:exodeoxyribonuclease III
MTSRRSTRAASSSASAAASAAAKISDPAADHEDDDAANVIATTGGGTVGKEPEEKGDEKTMKKAKGAPVAKKKKVVAEAPMPPEVEVEVEDGDGDVSGGARAKKVGATKRKRKSPAPTAPAPAPAAASASSSDDVAGSAPPPPPAAAEEAAKTKKKKAAVAHQQWTERTPLVRLWDPAAASSSDEPGGSHVSFAVISWNVAGMRALIKNRPNALPDLAARYDADVLCLQETKLQAGNMDDPKLKLREYFETRMGGYDCHWSYSIEKKGYSGTAMFVRKRGGVVGPDRGGDDGDGEGEGDGEKGAPRKGKKKQATLGAFFGSSADDVGGEGGADRGSTAAGGDVPVSHLRPISVETELGLPAHDGEGRTITAEFPLFYLTNVYVPNSGQKLERLGYRTGSWDADFLAKMRRLGEEGGKPVIWLGDLNVAHGAKDTWNEGAKHLAKSAGTTAEERASFEAQLGAGFVDAFRHLHPDGRGHYSYWSQRAGNREPNKGLRLDYFICSSGLMEDGDGKKAIVRDCYMVPDELGSDHCPILLVSGPEHSLHDVDFSTAGSYNRTMIVSLSSVIKEIEIRK